MKLTSSILSFRERGNDGQSSYRGNCSGYVIESLIDHYNIDEISDICAVQELQKMLRKEKILFHIAMI